MYIQFKDNLIFQNKKKIKKEIGVKKFEKEKQKIVTNIIRTIKILLLAKQLNREYQVSKLTLKLLINSFQIIIERK